MASDKAYLDFLLEQLRELDDISCRPMMGEFLLYYREKIFGGIYRISREDSILCRVEMNRL